MFRLSPHEVLAQKPLATSIAEVRGHGHGGSSRRRAPGGATVARRARGGSMSEHGWKPPPVIVRVLAVAGLAAAGLVANLLWPVHTDIRKFDADRMARLDTDMWRSYYARDPVKLYFQLARLLREEFHMTRARSYVTAFRAARAAFVFKRGHARSDYEKALPDLERYFADIRAISTTVFDVDRAAKTELEWWIVHRERTRHGPGDLSRSLAVAAAAIYNVEPARLARYG